MKVRWPTTRNPTSRQAATLSAAITSLQTFAGSDLTPTLAQIEGSLQSITLDRYAAVLAACGAKSEVLGAAGLVKEFYEMAEYPSEKQKFLYVLAQNTWIDSSTADEPSPVC